MFIAEINLLSLSLSNVDGQNKKGKWMDVRTKRQIDCPKWTEVKREQKSERPNDRGSSQNQTERNTDRQIDVREGRKKDQKFDKQYVPDVVTWGQKYIQTDRHTNRETDKK